MKRIVSVAVSALLSMTGLAQTMCCSGLDAAHFDSIIDGNRTGLFTLRIGQEMEASVTNYGARLVSLVYKGKDVVLGFDNVGDYRRYRQNYGATVGRYIGRISKARFTLDGQEYLLQGHEQGKNISHGGYPGFADRVWDVVGQTDSTLTLQYESPDGENGFPGNLNVRLTYKLSCKEWPVDDTLLTLPALELNYEATTDKPTVLNLSNHSFFNISGNPEKEITRERLFVNSHKIAAYDAHKNLTGQMIEVEGTPFDFFSMPMEIGSRIDEDNPQLKVTGGYDHSFALNAPGNDRMLAARLYDPDSRVTMMVYTTEPALHIYTGNGLKGNTPGKQGISYPRRSAVCFEAMHFSDSPNLPHFPSTILRPGEQWHSHTAFVFGMLE